MSLNRSLWLFTSSTFIYHGQVFSQLYVDCHVENLTKQSCILSLLPSVSMLLCWVNIIPDLPQIRAAILDLLVVLH